MCYTHFTYALRAKLGGSTFEGIKLEVPGRTLMQKELTIQNCKLHHQQ